MKNVHATAKMKLTKTVVTRYTKPHGPTGFFSTSEPTVIRTSLVATF